MRWIIAGTAASLLAGAPARAATASIGGDWLTPGANARVHMAPCASQPALMCGTLVWLKMPNDEHGAPQRDVKNPDIKLRGRPLIGLGLISGFRNAGAGSWVNGKIYVPGEGQTYDSKMRLNPGGTLKVEGCILIICIGQTWTRPA
ncbi:MAG: DUF2147 domain-containing protein [Caulobacterales bacterium]